VCALQKTAFGTSHQTQKKFLVLPAARDSVFGRNIRDMEIIPVNDGSRDDSLRICEHYVYSDPRFLRKRCINYCTK
jgi:glycosyltransferase involved in cell wall biosynthesis